MKKVSVSGTFNRFHKGHRALIDKAFEVGDEIYIGITSDEFASTKSVDVADFETRKKAVDDYVSTKGKPYHFKRIDDPLELGFMKDMDILVVSEETVVNGRKIVESLAMDGKRLELVVIPMVGSKKTDKISSSGIIEGLYDENGN